MKTPLLVFNDKGIYCEEADLKKKIEVRSIIPETMEKFPYRGHLGLHLQSNSQLLFSVFRDYEEDNLLYLQAFREIFEHQLEEGRLRIAMERIASQKIVWKKCEKPTPFSFPIITDRLREKLSSEKVEDRIRKMLQQLEK